MPVRTLLAARLAAPLAAFASVAFTSVAFASVALVSVALVSATPLHAQVADPPPTEVPADSAAEVPFDLDAFVTAELEESLATGLIVGVVVDGELDFLEAWGQSAEGGDALQVTDTFAYPALTEVLVAMTVRALGAGGMIDPTAPLATFLSGLSERLGQVTLDQLLTHTSGLADDFLPDDLLAIDADAFVAAPGEVYSISRYNYPLAAAVLEGLLNHPFAEIATQAVLTPLAMTSSTFDVAAARQGRLVTGYNATAAGPEAVEPAATFQGLPVLYTTALDVLQLLATWMSGDIRGSDPLQAGADEAIRLDDSFRMGDGVTVDVEALVPHAWLTRLDAGFGTMIHFYPGPETALFAVSNGPLPRTSVLWVRQRVAEAVGDIETQMATEGVPVYRSTESTRTPTGLDDLTPWQGVYRNGPIQLALRLVDGQLRYFDGSVDLPLQGVGPATFAHWTDAGAVSLRLVEVSGGRAVLIGGKVYRWESADVPGTEG